MRNTNRHPIKNWLFPAFIIYGITVFYFMFKLNPLLFSNENLADQFTSQKNQQPILFNNSSKLSSEENTNRPSQKAKKRTGDSDYSHSQNYFFYQTLNLIQKIEIQTQIKNENKLNWVIDENHYLFFSNKKSIKKYDLNGEFLWEFKSSDTKIPLEIIGKPTVSGSQIFVTTKSGVLYSLDKNTGQFMWSLNFLQSISSEPSIIKNKIYLSITKNKKSRLFRVNTLTGKIEWKSKVIQKITINKFSASKKLLFVVSDKFIYSFDLKTGSIVWRANSQGSILFPIVVTNNSIFATNKEGQSFALKQKNGAKQWEYILLAPVLGAPTYNPALRALALQTEDSQIHFIETKTGKKKWKLKSNIINPHSGFISVRLNHKAAKSINQEQAIWSLWGPCGKKSLCIYNAKNGQNVARFKLTGALAAPVKPTYNGFWAAVEDGSKIKFVYYQKSQRLDKTNDNDDN